MCVYIYKEEAVTVWAHYSSAYFEQGAGRQACNNPYHQECDKNMYQKMQASGIWKIKHENFVKLIQPSFGS